MDDAEALKKQIARAYDDLEFARHCAQAKEQDCLALIKEQHSLLSRLAAALKEQDRLAERVLELEARLAAKDLVAGQLYKLVSQLQ